MSIKHIFTVALAAAALSSIGCAKEEPEPAKLIEPARPPQPVLTSTVTTAKPEPALVEPPEPTVVDVEPKPEPSEAPLEPTIETVDGVTIQRFLTTSEIAKREPVEPTSTFGPHHERVYAFVEVSNESESDKSLFVHFIGPKGQVSGGIELEIPASVPRWRTWAYTRYFDAPGSWRVEIRDAEGSLLGALPFEVEDRL
jgi:hypothetical protein